MAIEERVVAVQRGETEEYAHIVKAYQQQIFVYCCRLMGSQDEAEDAVQDIFFKGYSAIKSYRPTVSFNAWIYRIAYNHCLTLMRRRQAHTRLQWLFKEDSVTESPEDRMVKQVINEPLAAELSRLSPYERSLLILHVFHDKTFVEIGEMMDKSPDAVRKKVSRIKCQLKQALKQWEEEKQWRTQPAWMRMRS